MRDTTTNTTTNTTANTTTNAATVGEVIVKGTVTTTPTSDNRLVSDETLDGQTQTLKNTVSRLESELKQVTSRINCQIHGEFDDLRNYVDQALERDRLKKRD